MIETAKMIENIRYILRGDTGFSVSARCTFVYTNVISLPSPCSREKGEASELGSLEIKDFYHGT